jgi:hypothetical protein
MRFDEFVTDEMIITLLCKEKCKRIRRAKISGLQNIDEELKIIMPTRNEWLRVNKSKRFINNYADNSKQQIPGSVLQLKSLLYTVRKHRETSTDKPYVINLNNYIARIKGICNGSIDFSFIKPAIIPKLKEETETEMIYRPISKYDSLDDKLMLNLTNQYLSLLFDPYFHEEILSYRIRRIYKGERKITNQHDAIKTIKKYLIDNKEIDIFVAECDIRKFFDILNHRIIKREFSELISNFTDTDSEQITRLFYSYVDSYSYISDVANKNSDQDYWNMYRVNPRNSGKARKFSWVSEEGFMQNGIYTREEWDNESLQIGTPQGGALSLLISNIVLNSVDKAIVGDNDPSRLFVRYGDDILLMHTDKKKCEELIERYKVSLVSHKLLFHPFKPVSEFKENEKITKEYWNNKSKSVFKWGKGAGDAAQWIGFVGYEISRDGEVRIRKSTLSGQFSRINRAYHHIRRLKAPQRNSIMRFGELVAEKLDFFNFKFIKSKLFAESFRELTINRHSLTQIKSLDRYRNRKFRKLSKQVRQAGLNRRFYLGKPFSYYYHFGKLNSHRIETITQVRNNIAFE